MSDFYFSMVGRLGHLVQFIEDKFWRRRSSKVHTLSGHCLYHFYLSPFAMRARIASYKLGLDFPFKEVLCDAQAHRELLTGGGKDQVPCLRIESEGQVRWMYESSDIIAYLKSVAR